LDNKVALQELGNLVLGKQALDKPESDILAEQDVRDNLELELGEWVLLVLV
jgi:hypothetical protein